MASFTTLHLSGKTTTLKGMIGAYPVAVVENSMKNKPAVAVDLGANCIGKLGIPEVIAKVVGINENELVAVVVKVMASRNLVPFPGFNKALPLYTPITAGTEGRSH